MRVFCSLEGPTIDCSYLTASARFMWEQLAAGVHESEIPAMVSSNYGIAITRARKDFQTTLRRWRLERLLPRGGILQRYELATLAFNIRFHDARNRGLISARSSPIC